MQLAVQQARYRADGGNYPFTGALTDPNVFLPGTQIWLASGANGSLSATAGSQVDLGSLYLGLVDAHVLAAAGQVTGPASEVDALSALFRTALPPVNASGF